MKNKMIKDLDLAKTYGSGQVFSWEEADGAYVVPIGSSLYLLRQIGDHIAGAELLTEAGLLTGERGPDEAASARLDAEFASYFDLGRNYAEIYDEIALKHPELAAAAERARGIRLLKQDEDEMLLTFILSQNNHIPRIKRSMAVLKERYGPELGSYEGRLFYGLPDYERLSTMTEADFVELGAGYRAPYLVSAIGFMPELKATLSREDRSTELIMNKLLEIHGVGPKVAACIALFGYGCWDVFPIDTWVKKALRHYYGVGAEKGSFIREKIAEFGPYSSLVQQLMFFHMREGSKDERRTKNK